MLFPRNNFLYISMELYEKEDLSSVLSLFKFESDHLDEKLILKISDRLCSALKYFHSQNIIHRDIKPQNVFLNNNYEVKLGDFGLARVFSSKSSMTTTQAGTPLYIATEILLRQNYPTKVDIWALGCLIYDICTFKYPFDGSNYALLTSILEKQVDLGQIKSRYSIKLVTLKDGFLLKGTEFSFNAQ